MTLSSRLQQRWRDVHVSETRALRDAFIRDGDSAPPTWRYWAAQLVAALVFLAYLGLTAWSVWAIWRGLHPLHFGFLVAGLLASLLVVAARPSLIRIPLYSVHSAKDAPCTPCRETRMFFPLASLGLIP